MPEQNSRLDATPTPVVGKQEPTAPMETSPVEDVAGLVDGRYRIESELGRGGIGVVYRARDERMEDRPVVVKVLLDRATGSDWLQRKFKDEVRALVRLNHPGVVGALDSGVLPDGRPYLVMEFVPGATLRARMQAGGIPPSEAADVIQQMGRALTAAHERGIYHRDLKPENVMIQDLGHGQRLAKIIDFGIATVKESGAASTELTRAAGTPPYMAPEQLAGKPTAASDTYAMAVIAYEMLTGTRPSPQGAQYEPPSRLCPGLSADCDAVILRGLSFRAEQRPASARELGESLARAVSGSRTGGPPAATRAVPETHARARPAPLTTLVPGSRYDVFISYRREDGSELAHLVRNALTGRGLKVFLDVRELGAGRFDAALFGRIEEAADFIVLLTPKSLGRCLDAGDWLTQEIAHAIQTQRNVVPLSAPGFVFPSPSELPESIASLPMYQSVAYDHRFSEEAMNRLYATLKSRQRARTKRASWIAAAAGLAVVLTLGVALRSRVDRGTGAAASPSAPLASPVHNGSQWKRTLSYHLLVQKYRNGKPYRDPFRLPGELLFGVDDRIRVVVSSPQAGHLYIINEGPLSSAGLPSYNVLFPTTSTHGGSAVIASDQGVSIPEKSWFAFDEQEGTEKLWMIWSARAVPELEAVKHAANPNDRGVVRDAAEIGAVRAFLAEHSAANPKIERDDASQSTLLKGSGDVLVNLLKLAHH